MNKFALKDMKKTEITFPHPYLYKIHTLSVRCPRFLWHWLRKGLGVYIYGAIGYPLEWAGCSMTQLFNK